MNPDDDCGHTHLAAAWVLGTLTAEEAQRFEAHLAGCGSCQAEVASLQEAADAMADAVPPVAPPPALRARLMTAVKKEVELFRAASADDPESVDVRRPRRRLLRSALLVVAAVVLVVAGMVLGGVLADPEERRAVAIPGRVAAVAGGPDASATIMIRGDETTLALSGIDGPEDGRIYQAWLERAPSAAVSTGALFSVGVGADAMIRLPPLGDARRMIVTSEPSGGSTVPTLPPVVVVDLPTPGRTR